MFGVIAATLMMKISLVEFGSPVTRQFVAVCAEPADSSSKLLRNIFVLVIFS